MPSFTDDFTSIGAWTFENISESAHLTADGSPPAGSPGGGSAGKIHYSQSAPFGGYFAVSRLDLVDGGDNTRTDWIVYSFYLADWNDLYQGGAGAGSYALLPGHSYSNNPSAQGGNGFAPSLHPTSSTTGYVGGMQISETVSVSAGAWHTIRHAMRIAGASSTETLYVDGTLVGTTTFNPGVSAGSYGPMVWDDQNYWASADVWIDDLTWSPGADPGEPTGGNGGGAEPDALRAASVLIDDVDVSTCVLSGSVTRRLNRPWSATWRMPSDCDAGTPCSKVKIFLSVGGSNVLWFHGFVDAIERQCDEDSCYTEYTATDVMSLWRWRPVRDDDGDFSKPDILNTYQFAPQILEAMLVNSESAGGGPDADAEGPTFIDLAGSTFATGVADMSAAPVDWPMTIAELFELLAGTGQLDAILTPIDSGGNMASLAVYNGNYGTNLTASVNFDYATGDFNVRALRQNIDSTNVCNKLWYYLGPRVGVPTDPAGDQHWRANVTGSAGAGNPLNNPPFNDPGTDPPNVQDIIIARRDQSREDCGVRMEIQIYDAQGDENPAEFRYLYQYRWQMEQYLRSVPRELIHITPVRISDADLLPAGVNPVQVGDFDIGDLVTVSAGAIVGGGFTGAQRIYEYTINWDENGVIEIGELQTSADQEGIIAT